MIKPLEELIASVNESLTPKKILNAYLDRFTSKFRDSVFRIEELGDLRTESDWSTEDLIFINELLNEKVQNDKNELISLISYYFQLLQTPKRVAADAEHLPKNQIKLRRTAAVLYKAARISLQKVHRGADKRIQGPLGIDSALVNDNLEGVLSQIGPISAWNGLFSQETGRQRRFPGMRRLLRAALTPKELGKGKTVKERIDSGISKREKVKREYAFVAGLADHLRHPSYLPGVSTRTPDSQYLEFVPEPYFSETYQEVVESAHSLIRALEDLWRKAGVINLDLKSANLRKRPRSSSAKDVVIIDWGSRVEIEPGAERFELPKITANTPAFNPPEVELAMSNEFDRHIQVERFLVFQIGIIILTVW